MMYYEIIFEKNELGATALKNYFPAHSTGTAVMTNGERRCSASSVPQCGGGTAYQGTLAGNVKQILLYRREINRAVRQIKLLSLSSCSIFKI